VSAVVLLVAGLLWGAVVVANITMLWGRLGRLQRRVDGLHVSTQAHMVHHTESLDSRGQR